MSRRRESVADEIEERRALERHATELLEQADQHLVALLRCPPTGRTQAMVDEMRKRQLGDSNRQANLRSFERDLVLCEERDRLQASRPDGCTCLGTGFRPARHTPCSCANGAAIEQKLAGFRATYWAGVWNDRTAAFRDSVGRRLADFTLDSFPTTTPAARKLLASIRARTADERRPSFWLAGPNGTGKSGLAKAIAEELVFTGAARDAVFLPVPDLLHKLKGTYDQRGSEYQVLQETRDVDVLVLDDFGAERVTESGWAAERLFLVVNHRYDEMLQTIVTSNLTPSQLGKHLGDQGPRIVWRLLEMCDQQVFSLAGMPNLRAPKALPKLEVVNG